MSSQMDFVQPSPIALGLVKLFAPAGDAESIVGDLLEEFSQLASQLGVLAARRWFWRQTVKTIPLLLVTGFRSAPWTITALVVGGFLLRWLFSLWSNPAVNRAIEAALDRYHVYERDPHTYIFWFTHAQLFERLIVNSLIGVVVALAARRREMTATVMLGLVGDVLAVQAVWMGVAKTGDQGLLWTLPWSFTFSLAVVVGGAIVRVCRLSAATAS